MLLSEPSLSRNRIPQEEQCLLVPLRITTGSTLYQGFGEFVDA